MDPARRDRLAASSLAVLAAVALLALTTREAFWNGDFLDESWPPYFALVSGGGLRGFLATAPAYAPFATVVGVPATLLLDAVGRVDRAATHIDLLLKLVALPGVAALVLLAVRLARDVRALPGVSRAAWLLVILVVAGSPLAGRALLAGHPEDLLAGAAAVGAVLCARDGRLRASALLIALAVATKQWAVLATLPAALAAPRPRGGLIAAVGGTAAGALAYIPFALARPDMHASYTTAAGFFHPQQVWWPLGVPAPAAWEAAGHGSLVAPAWLAPFPHLLIVALALPLSVAWWRRAGASRDRHDALLLLSLLFVGRCALDPWNLAYYQLPLVLALVAWETRRGQGMPALTLGVTAATWVTFVTIDAREGMGPFVGYMIWVVPLALFMAARLYAKPRRALVAATAPG